ncbi:hypothetical protein EDB84DRAFT_1654326 [Lactarius hengduanensis]|nr:hypothetical protein EDB84DRAFT_1654326 [Lactarius hengduanensis]
MNATLRDRLILVEQLFLIAVVAQDETARKEFSLELSRLIHHYKAVEANGDLDDNTTLLLSRVSQVIGATTQCMLECEDILKDTQTHLMNYSSLPLPSDDLLPVPTSRPTFTPYPLLFSHVSSSGTLGILGHNKLLDACAYRWLMQHVHNPYPTSTQLQIIGDESKSSVAQAELWFQEARDLIGWTRLSDEFFTGSLNATITAAKRVYLEYDNTVPFCITFAFSKVKASMETLFSEHLTLLTPLTNRVECSAQAPQPVPGLDHFKKFREESIANSNCIQVSDPTHFNNILDDEEIEDTTPPPPVAGCKRNLPEDMATLLASDLHRPLKRLRAQSLHQVYLHSESMHPLSNTNTSFKKSATEALTHTSAIPVTSVQLSDSSFPMGSKPPPDSLAFNSTEQEQTDLYASASEMVVASSDPPISQGEMRNQQISDGSLVPSERQLGSSVNHRRHPSPGSIPTFAWPFPPSLNYHPTDSLETSQITVSPGAPVDLSVFDWSSIPNPLAETTVLTNQPASVYVPSSDLTALNFELPDPLYLEQSAETCPLGDLGSLEDLSLPQFPIPTTFPDVPASPSASFCSDNTTYSSQEMDWSAITDFINQFSSFSAESSFAPSPSATFDAAPSTPENPIGPLLPPAPHEVNKPISVMDPSIPPSVFFPAEPSIFTEDASMWSLLCGPS